MGRELGVEHPNIFRFIDALRSIQTNRDKIQEEYIGGGNAANKRRVYREADCRIRRIVRDGYDRPGSPTLIEYLRGLAHNYDMTE